MTHRFINADSIASTGLGFVGTNMFAYCNNSPALFVDVGGNIPAFAVMETDSGTLPQELRNTIEFVEYAHEHNIPFYYTADSAASAWAEENRMLSETTERASYIYKYLNFYFYTETYKGSAGNAIMSPNVIIPTFILEFKDLFVNATVVAQIHTHPNPGQGYHNDFPSINGMIRGGDRLAMQLFGYTEMYIVPYKHCSGTPEIIKYSDESTWCPYH